MKLEDCKNDRERAERLLAGGGMTMEGLREALRTSRQCVYNIICLLRKSGVYIIADDAGVLTVTTEVAYREARGGAAKRAKQAAALRAAISRAMHRAIRAGEGREAELRRQVYRARVALLTYQLEQLEGDGSNVSA